VRVRALSPAALNLSFGIVGDGCVIMRDLILHGGGGGGGRREDIVQESSRPNFFRTETF